MFGQLFVAEGRGIDYVGQDHQQIVNYLFVLGQERRVGLSNLE